MPEPTHLQIILPVTCLQAQLFCIFLPVTIKYFGCSLGWRNKLCNQLLKNSCEPSGAPDNMLNSLQPHYNPVSGSPVTLQGWAHGVRVAGKTRGLSQSAPKSNHSQWQILSGKDKQRPSAQWYPTNTLSQLPEICKGSLSQELYLCLYFWSIMPWFHVIIFWTQISFWHSQGTQFQSSAFCCTQGLWHTP